MNQDTNTIEEYFSKLPSVIQQCVLSNEWQKKVVEIAGKYSLNSKQTANLQFEITFVVVGIESEADLLENLKREVEVSDLLAEQLVKDIDQRLLSWLDKLYESNNSGKVELSLVPEIRPNNLPMQGSNFIPTPKPAFKNETLDKQKPPQTTSLGVPRYATENIEVNAVSTVPSNKSNNAGNIIENKLNNVTTGIRETPPIKYEKDPYREPLG